MASAVLTVGSAPGESRGSSPGGSPPAPAPPPLPGLVETFSYVPARDGLAMLGGGPTQRGYAAQAAGHPRRLWQPRITQTDDPKGGTDVYSGNYQWNADPEYPWSSHYSPFAVVNGDLRIRAQTTESAGLRPREIGIEPISGAPYQYVSGYLSSKNSFSQQGGYFEITAMMPHGTATWPDFYLLPVDENHPPEIDINEYLGQDPDTVYRATAISRGPTEHQAHVDAGTDLSAGYHTYAAYITDKAVTFYLDHARVAVVDVTDSPEYDVPFYMAMNVQIGSRIPVWVPAPDATTPNPADMLVKSVRVWQRPGPIGVALSAASYFDSTPVGGSVAVVSAKNFGASAGNAFVILDDPEAMFALVANRLTLRRAVPATAEGLHRVRIQVTDNVGRTWQRLFSLRAVAAVPTSRNFIAAQDLTNPAWTKDGLAALDSAKLLENPGRGRHALVNAAAIERTAGVATYNLSVDAMSLGRDWVNLQVFDATYTHSAQAWFDLEHKTIGYYTQGGGWTKCSPYLLNAPGGRTRIGFTFTTDQASTGFQVIAGLATAQSRVSYQGSSDRGVGLENLWLYEVGGAPRR